MWKKIKFSRVKKPENGHIIERRLLNLIMVFSLFLIMVSSLLTSVSASCFEVPLEINAVNGSTVPSDLKQKIDDANDQLKPHVKLIPTLDINGNLLVNKVDDPSSISGEAEGVLTSADRKSLWTTEFEGMRVKLYITKQLVDDNGTDEGANGVAILTHPVFFVDKFDEYTLAHEFLHTMGVDDQYDDRSRLSYGYADKTCALLNETEERKLTDNAQKIENVDLYSTQKIIYFEHSFLPPKEEKEKKKTDQVYWVTKTKRTNPQLWA